MQKRHLILAVLLFVLSIAPVLCSERKAYASDTESVTLSVTYGQDEARSMLNMVNNLRTGGSAWYWNSDNTTKTEVGALPALTYDYELEKVALLRAKEIAVSFSHQRPNGESWTSAYTDCGYMRSGAGENIAAGYKTAAEAFDGWLEENRLYSGQGHRRNMLQNYTAIGIAHVVVHGVHFWVQEFNSEVVSAAPVAAPSGSEMVNIDVLADDIEDVYAVLPSGNKHVGIYDADSVIMLGGTPIDSVYALYAECGQKYQIPKPEIYMALSSSFCAIPIESDCYFMSDSQQYVTVEDGTSLRAVTEGTALLYSQVCGMMVYVPVMVEHSFDNGTVDVEATCTGSGVTVYTCAGCGTTYTEITEPLGHVFETAYFAATPDANGFYGNQCKVCDVIEDIELIPKIEKAVLQNDSYTYQYKTYRKPKVKVYDAEGDLIDSSYYKVKYSGYAKVGKATATITFDSIFYQGNVVCEYMIFPKATDFTALSSQKKGFKASWSKVTKQCSGYEIQYSLKTSMKSAKKLTVNKAGTHTAMIGDLKSGKRYYVRIRSFKNVDGKKLYSEWSGISSILTK